MKRFESIINNAIKQNISDIHITGEHPMVTRNHGNIQFHNSMILTHKDIDDLTRKLLTPLQLDRLRQNKSVDVSFSTSNTRLRINVFTSARGISIAIRILPGPIPTIEELNLHPSLHDISKIKSGLVLICGSSGVGKTTTIAAIINDINKSRQAHIVTLEDPIEYRFQSNKSFIEQRELGSHMPSFEQGLIDVLREDADVIVVGELREGETMRLALDAAESGHLVIATLHASSPEEASLSNVQFCFRRCPKRSAQPASVHAGMDHCSATGVPGKSRTTRSRSDHCSRHSSHQEHYSR